MNYYISQENYTMQSKNLFLILICNLVLSTTLVAQEFTPSYKWQGEVRIRSEADMRDFNQKTPANTYTLLRSRFGVEALPAENVRVYIQAQDSRVFGSERDVTGFNTLSDTKNIDLHLGYIEMKQFLLHELTIRLGRQELSYGNERLVGAVGWHNVGRSFDGALFRFDFEHIMLDAFGMNTVEVQPYTPAATSASTVYVRDAGQNFYGVNLTLKSIKDHKLDTYLFYQWNRNQTLPNEDDLRRFTLGTYAKGAFDSFSYEAELAYQGGSIVGTDISAFLLAINAGYTFNESILNKFTVGYEYLSGTAAGDTKYKSFDPMYHTGHKFYGFMDYFINIPANTSGRGLTDMFARTTFKFSNLISVNAWFHHFTLAQDLVNEKGLGQEIDITSTYKYNDVVTFDLGLSTFIPASVMRLYFGKPDLSFWGYLATTVVF